MKRSILMTIAVLGLLVLNCRSDLTTNIPGVNVNVHACPFVSANETCDESSPAVCGIRGFKSTNYTNYCEACKAGAWVTYNGTCRPSNSEQEVAKEEKKELKAVVIPGTPFAVDVCTFREKISQYCSDDLAPVCAIGVTGVQNVTNRCRACRKPDVFAVVNSTCLNPRTVAQAIIGQIQHILSQPIRIPFTKANMTLCSLAEIQGNCASDNNPICGLSAVGIRNYTSRCQACSSKLVLGTLETVCPTLPPFVPRIPQLPTLDQIKYIISHYHLPSVVIPRVNLNLSFCSIAERNVSDCNNQAVENVCAVGFKLYQTFSSRCEACRNVSVMGILNTTCPPLPTIQQLKGLISNYHLPSIVIPKTNLNVSFCSLAERNASACGGAPVEGTCGVGLGVYQNFTSRCEACRNRSVLGLLNTTCPPLPQIPTMQQVVQIVDHLQIPLFKGRSVHVCTPNNREDTCTNAPIQSTCGVGLGHVANYTSICDACRNSSTLAVVNSSCPTLPRLPFVELHDTQNDHATICSKELKKDSCVGEGISFVCAVVRSGGQEVRISYLNRCLACQNPNVVKITPRTCPFLKIKKM